MMSGELVPLVSPSTPAIRLVGAGVVYSVDLPYLREGLLSAGEMLIYDEYPYKVVRQDRRLIGRPANDNWVTTSVTYEQDNPGRVFRVGDQLTLGPLQAIYMRPVNRGIIAGESGKSYAIVRFNGAGTIDLLNHSVNESLVIGDVVKMAAFVAVAMYAAPYVVASVETAIAAVTPTPAFVGPIDAPLLVGPVEVAATVAPTVVTPATVAVADIAPFVGPIEPLVTTAPGWTLAETIAAAKTVGTTTMEGVKVLNQVAGAVGAVAAVSAAIQGPSGGSAQAPAQAPAPAPAPEPDSVVEKFAAVFDDLKTQLSSVDKNTWYMVGGAVVLLSMG